MLFWYPRAEPLFKKFTLFSPLSRPLILASPVFAILKNVIALYLCAFYVLFEYLRAKPLFKKLTLISPPSHPLNLASPIFVISNNVIALHLCAFYVLFGFLRAEPLFQKFTLFSPLSHPLILQIGINEILFADKVLLLPNGIRHSYEIRYTLQINLFLSKKRDSSILLNVIVD